MIRVMSDQSSSVISEYEVGSVESTMRLKVRKDLFPDEQLSKHSSSIEHDDLEDISCVKLETDFEQSIDEIAQNKHQMNNGAVETSNPRHRKHKQQLRREKEFLEINGIITDDKKRKKKKHIEKYRASHKRVQSELKSSKNFYIVHKSEYEIKNSNAAHESSSSDDEVLKYSVRLPVINLPRQSGKPFSHELSQLSTKKKRKSKSCSKDKTAHIVTPCSGKPRSMMSICKKKKKKKESAATYQSQMVANTKIKIKIRRQNDFDMVTPASVADIGLKKSKKKRAATPVISESSGEEYDPAHGETAAAVSVAAPKPRATSRSVPNKTRKPCNTKKEKHEKTEKNRSSKSAAVSLGPQSPWGESMPEEILVKIFEHAVTSQGTLPTVIRLGRVCKLWHSVSCRPELWKNVDLAQYTVDKCKTDYKLVWLLENRLSKCQVLNIGQWKVCNVSWVLACVAEYCTALRELGVAGWSRLAPDHLYDVVRALPRLARLDLSHTSESGGSGSCLSAASVARVTEEFGARLTHLTLANNKFTALSQILASIAAHCPNLEVLDISGARASSHPAPVPLEALQRGCPRLRVFRAANAQLVLANPNTHHQAQSEAGPGGWSQLEELSIAGEASTELVGEYRLDDDALERLVRNATRLRLLDVRALHRLTDSGLVRVPAWDLQHLFLGGCNVTRQSNACLELICEKWSHSLLELDLAWATAARALDLALHALADAPTSNLRTLNLCGSSVSLEPVKKVLLKCTRLESINLSSCRALPRGMKRLYVGKELQDLIESLYPEKTKTKDNNEKEETKDQNKTKEVKNTEAETNSPNDKISQSDLGPSPKDASATFEMPKSLTQISATQTNSPEATTISSQTVANLSDNTSKCANMKLPSPSLQSRPDSSSTPRSDLSKNDLGSPHYSPVAKPDSQSVVTSETQMDSGKINNSWSLGQFKSTPSHKSEASPLNRNETQNKNNISKTIEQCSPTTSLENKLSPETTSNKLDSKTGNSWNYGSYSPMPTRAENQLSTQKSPYSAQPSPYSTQPSPYSTQQSPYSTQPSPYSTQPSPYSSQQSPYSAQPSPDTSQMIKTEMQKPNAWNTGSYSPMPKNPTPFSPHTSHTSPDPGMGLKDVQRGGQNKTGQYSPMSRQERIHQSPYSPRPSVQDTSVHSNKKSPAVGNYSPMVRSDAHLPSPERNQSSRQTQSVRAQEMYNRALSKVMDILPSVLPQDITSSWGADSYNTSRGSGLDCLSWGEAGFPGEEPLNSASSVSHSSVPVSTWAPLMPFGATSGRQNSNTNEPWTLGQFRVDPSQQAHTNFLGQNVNFDTLSAHIGHDALSQSYIDESFAETSRVD